MGKEILGTSLDVWKTKFSDGLGSHIFFKKQSWYKKEKPACQGSGESGMDRPSLPPPSYHGNALRVAVQVGRGAAAAAARQLAASATGVLQGSNQGLAGDGTKLVAEGPIESENVNDKDPLADGGQVLQEEALVGKEGTACSGVKARLEEGGLGEGLNGGRTWFFCTGERGASENTGAQEVGRYVTSVGGETGEGALGHRAVSASPQPAGCHKRILRTRAMKAVVERKRRRWAIQKSRAETAV